MASISYGLWDACDTIIYLKLLLGWHLNSTVNFQLKLRAMKAAPVVQLASCTYKQELQD